ncbi:MAG TPA: PEP-CTERM sorting domain-containing protein [Tepidisphaeraceae bacterium]|nr:PEP-CTERM sorting domain-containing protein [Tepidisphaeraceae bacterium]
MRCRTCINVLAALILWTFASPCRSALIFSDGFESPPLAAGTTAAVNADGWTSDAGTDAAVWFPSSPTADFNSVAPLAAPADGNQLLTIVEANQNVERAVGTIQAATLYTLTVAIGDRISDSGLHDWDIQLWAGGSTRQTFLGQTFRTDSGANNPSAGNWADNSVTFDSTTDPTVVGQNLFVLVGTYLTGSNPGQSYFDNVRVDATSVPEPAATALLTIAIAATLRRRNCARY